MYEKFRTFCTNICIYKTYEIKFLELWTLDLKPLQNTFLVTFLNLVFRNDEHLFSRLHYNVKRKGYHKNNREVATGALENIF